MKRKFEEVITNEKDFREIMGHPSELVTKKTIDYIDENVDTIRWLVRNEWCINIYFMFHLTPITYN